MAKSYGKLAYRYAKALLRAVLTAQGNDGTPTPAQFVSRSLDGFAEVWKNQGELSETIINPMFEKQQRLAALMQVALLAEMPEVARDFLKLVFEHDRIRALPEIAGAFRGLADEAAGVVQVSVITAKDLAEDEAQEIEHNLRSSIAGQLVLSWQVDEQILGGVIVRFGGKVLDGSLRGRLERIRHELGG